MGTLAKPLFSQPKRGRAMRVTGTSIGNSPNTPQIRGFPVEFPVTQPFERSPRPFRFSFGLPFTVAKAAISTNPKRGRATQILGDVPFFGSACASGAGLAAGAALLSDFGACGADLQPPALPPAAPRSMRWTDPPTRSRGSRGQSKKKEQGLGWKTLPRIVFCPQNKKLELQKLV